MRANKKSIEQNEKLIEEYPFLLPRNAWTGEVDDEYDYSWTELDCIPGAWKDVYGILICEDLKRILGDKVNEFRFDDIKEKYGALRIYSNMEPKEWHTQLWKYEHLTENTCYECGKIGTPLTNDGWILPICRDCYEHPRKEPMYERRPYDEVVCKYDEGYKFSPIIKIRHASTEGNYIEKIDCSDILTRVDQKYKKDLQY